MAKNLKGVAVQRGKGKKNRGGKLLGYVKETGKKRKKRCGGAIMLLLFSRRARARQKKHSHTWRKKIWKGALRFARSRQGEGERKDSFTRPQREGKDPLSTTTRLLLQNLYHPNKFDRRGFNPREGRKEKFSSFKLRATAEKNQEKAFPQEGGGEKEVATYYLVIQHEGALIEKVKGSCGGGRKKKEKEKSVPVLIPYREVQVRREREEKKHQVAQLSKDKRGKRDGRATQRRFSS